MKISFAPSIYEHAARRIGRTPWDVSRSGELMYLAHPCRVLGIPPRTGRGGDRHLQPGDRSLRRRRGRAPGLGIPAIEHPLFATLDEALGIEPFDPQSAGRIAMSIDAARRLADEFPAADVRVPVAGPFSIAFNLRGIHGLCEDVACRPVDTARFLMQLADNQQAFCQQVRRAGLDIAFFESAAAPPILSPTQFRAIELPASNASWLSPRPPSGIPSRALWAAIRGWCWRICCRPARTILSAASRRISALLCTAAANSSHGEDPH